MRPSAVVTALHLLVTKRRPVFMWGPPGIGKSDLVRQVQHNLQIDLVDLRLNLLDSVDLKGFPTPNAKKTQMTWLPADFLPTGGEGILFLDEMNSAPSSVQAAAYQLILNRRIGDYVLPDGWAMVAAGNREGDRSVVNRMPAALANRFVHIDFEANIDDWIEWALANGAHSDLVAFMRFRPDLLHHFDPLLNNKAFPTPRSWMFVNELLHSPLDGDTEFELFKGTVGEGAAIELQAFLKVIRDLPTIEEILARPDTIAMPNSPATKYAIVTSLGMKADKRTFERMLTFVKRMDVEFQVLFMRDTAKRTGNTTESVTSLKAFTDWSIANSAVLL